MIDDLKKNILLFRHGQTDWNLIGRCQGGESDIPLNDQGKDQARRLAERMKVYDFSHLFSSPLSRALDTARIVQTETNAELRIIPDLIELMYGDAAGKWSKDAKKEYPEVYQEWFGKSLSETPDIGFPNGERRAPFVCRIMQAFQTIASEEFSFAGISTHSGVIWNFIDQIGGPRLDKIDFCEGHLIEVDTADGMKFLYKGTL